MNIPSLGLRSEGQNTMSTMPVVNCFLPECFLFVALTWLIAYSFSFAISNYLRWLRMTDNSFYSMAVISPVNVHYITLRSSVALFHVFDSPDIVSVRTNTSTFCIRKPYRLIRWDCTSLGVSPDVTYPSRMHEISIISCARSNRSVEQHSFDNICH